MTKDFKIKFYGKNDLSSGRQLQKIEIFFQYWVDNINNLQMLRILELYNIQKYIDNDMRLESWTNDQFFEYKKYCEEIPKIIGNYCSTINNNNINTIRKTVDWNYIEDFWQIIEHYNVYKRIEPKAFALLLAENKNDIWYVLRYKKLVNDFEDLIVEQLIYNPQTAKHLITQYLVKSSNTIKWYFPKKFILNYTEQIINSYINSENVNLKFLILLENAQSIDEYQVTDEIKLSAKRKTIEIIKQLRFSQLCIKNNIEVFFESIPDGAIKKILNKGENARTYIYSKEWIIDNNDYPTLLNNFIYMFDFVDLCMRCKFVSHANKHDIFTERFCIKGKKEYETNKAFVNMQMLSNLQMKAYCEQLQRINIKIEDIFKWFFENYLHDEFGVENYTYFSLSNCTTYLEKCRHLSISIDGVLKQYRLFCKKGEIDRDLLEISSEHIIFSNVPSLLTKKYAYCQSKKLENEMFLLFSDQVLIGSIEKISSKYKTLHQLILTEQVKKDDFEIFQQNKLDYLIERGAILFTDCGFLKINANRVNVLKDLYYNEVVCPHYYCKEWKKQIDQFVDAKDMKYENTLFSKSEQKYLNYILNKAEFNNGLDLRNKYIHETNSLSSNIHEKDYMELLKVMVLIIIKINEEFCLKN